MNRKLKSVFRKSTLFKFLVYIQKEDRKEVYKELYNICLDSKKQLIILGNYLSFLEDYNSSLRKKDYHLLYVYDYFLNLIDCIIYEKYFEIKEYSILKYVKKELVDLDIDGNNDKGNLEKILFVFEKLESDKKLNENLYMIKLNSDVKKVYR